MASVLTRDIGRRAREQTSQTSPRGGLRTFSPEGYPVIAAAPSRRSISLGPCPKKVVLQLLNLVPAEGPRQSNAAISRDGEREVAPIELQVSLRDTHTEADPVGIDGLTAWRWSVA